jgi:integrase
MLNDPNATQTPDILESQAVLSLHDVLQLIQDDQSLPQPKRTQWCCSLRRIPIFLAKNPRNLPARMGALRFGIIDLHHAALGISKKSLQNHISNLRAALSYVRGLHDTCGRNRPLSPCWEILYGLLDTKRLRRGLSSFVRFCSETDTPPAGVFDETINAFISYRLESSFTKHPKNLHKQVVRCWNEAAGTIDGWPTHKLTMPDYRPPHRLALDAFLDDFQNDVERYLSWLGGDAALDRPLRLHACKASTLATRRREIVGAVNAAVEAGIPIERLGSLADLVVPETAKRVLEIYLDRNQGKPTSYVIELADKLLSIARHWCQANEDDISKLKAFSARLGRHRRSGLTAKNLALVRQIKNPKVWQRICRVPEILMTEAEREDTAFHKAAIKAQLAVAIMILIVAPMRIGNLVTLNIHTNLQRPAGPDGPIHIVIPDYDVKNNVSLDYPLPLSVSRMIDQYLFRYRHRLKQSNSAWLFPGDTGNSKVQRTLSQQISERLWQHAGVRITPHQFRHAAAAVILEADPGNYELVRRVLGHKNIQTTIHFYVPAVRRTRAQTRRHC